MSSFIYFLLNIFQKCCFIVLSKVDIYRKTSFKKFITYDFSIRYRVLNPSAIPEGQFVDSKKACEKLIGTLDLDSSQYRFGNTKVLDVLILKVF